MSTLVTVILLQLVLSRLADTPTYANSRPDPAVAFALAQIWKEDHPSGIVPDSPSSIAPVVSGDLLVEAFQAIAELPADAPLYVPPKPAVVPPTVGAVAAAGAVRPSYDPAAYPRWSYDQIVAEMARYDWPLDGAIATATCESGMNQFAVNSSSGAIGLFQDISGNPALFDPANSIASAYAKWLAGGRSFWQHWTQWGGCGAGY